MVYSQGVRGGGASNAAVFVVDRELRLTYVKYGENAGDVPGPEELKKLLEMGAEKETR